MSKYKKIMIWSAVMMVGSLALIVHDVVKRSEFKIGNVATHVGLFLMGAEFLRLPLPHALDECFDVDNLDAMEVLYLS